MKRPVCLGGLVVACVASCGAPAGPGDLVAKSSSPIQGGTTDTTHLFTVGVVQLAQQDQNMVAFCTGVLLAPNLVATARHCVAMLASTTIDCTSSTFGALYPVNQVFVTTDTNITMSSPFNAVSQVIVPTGSSQTSVCGNDIALMILQTNIELPEYVTPVIDPPMTSPEYEPIVTAIGYGVDTPTDSMGMTAGTRRIKENVKLTCIPNDTSFADCFSDPAARQVLTATEFVSGDSTCEGDSGSGAFEQANFNAGRWVAFGILSRGGVSTDGATCEQPIYTRFDAWGSLIVDAAMQAEQAATAKGQSYPLPTWAGGVAATDAGAGAVDGTSCTATDTCSAEAGTAQAASASGGCSVTGGVTGAGGHPSTPRGPVRVLTLVGLVGAAAAFRRSHRRRARPRRS